MKRILNLLTAVLLAPVSAGAQDVFAAHRSSWLEKANVKPELKTTVLKPVSIVKAVKDASAFQGWRYEKVANPEELYDKNFKEVKQVTLDFGRHMVGHFTFHTRTLTRCQDAPVRIRFTFGELPAELNTPLDPWKGTLSRAWMQDEVVTITQVDSDITIPRRLACRYVKIELLGASPDFDFAIDHMQLAAVSSAGECRTALRDGCPQLIRDINRIGIETLHECMQTVYEDGPKRDHRLWVGDLYLESLANRYSFRNFDLTKRCLYVLAALSDDNGTVISNAFETPELHPQYGSICLSYSLLFNSTLLEYYRDTHDMATVRDLWEVARKQMETALRYVNEDGIFENCPYWLFFDWREGLDVSTPMQGATIFALEQTYDLAKIAGHDHEVRHWLTVASKMKKAAMKRLYDRRQGVFVSGNQRQVSVLSQAWMIISGAADRKTGRKALERALSDSRSVRPGTPYATHYLIEAMVRCGMNDEARAYLEDYWGGMVRKGADTFWEAYDPHDDFLSPYNFFPVNSACHAWSCTPAYFIHKYPGIFQE